MAAAEVVQMNIRISADIKRAGDAAFARAGYTPSQVVRRIWELAAKHANEPEFVRGMLEGDANLEKEHVAGGTVGKTLSKEQRIEAVNRGKSIVAEGMKKLGLSDEAIADFKENGIGLSRYDYKELLEEAIWEHHMEEGQL